MDLPRRGEGRVGSRRCWPREQGRALGLRLATEEPAEDTGLKEIPHGRGSRPAGPPGCGSAIGAPQRGSGHRAPKRRGSKPAFLSGGGAGRPRPLAPATSTPEAQSRAVGTRYPRPGCAGPRGLLRTDSGTQDLSADHAGKAPAAATFPEDPVGAPRAEFSSGRRR